MTISKDNDQNRYLVPCRSYLRISKLHVFVLLEKDYLMLTYFSNVREIGI